MRISTIKFERIFFFPFSLSFVRLSNETLCIFISLIKSARKCKGSRASCREVHWTTIYAFTGNLEIVFSSEKCVVFSLAMKIDFNEILQDFSLKIWEIFSSDFQGISMQFIGTSMQWLFHWNNYFYFNFVNSHKKKKKKLSEKMQTKNDKN